MANRNKPELTLRGLRAFIVVEETGSVSEGAKLIGGSSSGISQQISTLEQAIGTQLFDRQSRPLRLTPAGQMVNQKAREILEAIDSIQINLLQNNLVDFPKLDLAIVDDLDTSLTPILVGKLQRRFRNCFVNAYSGRSDTIVEQLQERKVDIAISASVPDNVHNFNSIQILREQYILVAAKGLIRKDEEIKQQMLNAPFIQYSEAIPMGRRISQHLKRSRFVVSNKYALEASRSVVAMVAQSDGWAITTPLNLLDAERFIPQIDVMPIPFPAFSRSIYLLTRTSELGQLSDRLAEDCRQIIESQVISRFSKFVPRMKNTIEIIRE